MYNIPANYLFDQSRLCYLPSCHSTNAIALQLAHQQAHEGTIVLTDCQTAGQGQRGNTWEAEPGKNLTFSILLKPGFIPINLQFQLNKLTTLALCDTLNQLGVPECRIKWPNDLYVGAQKVCGILIQNTIQGTSIGASVIGIGLNVNQENFSMSTATSLTRVLNKSIALNEVLQSLLTCFAERYQQLRENLYVFDEEYLSKLYLKDVKSLYQSELHGTFEGTIRNVDESGRLVVENEEGEILYFQFQEIKLVSGQ